MADVFSDVATVQQGGTLAKLTPNVIGGKVRSIHAVYTGAGSETAGTVIHVAALPAGARVLPISTVAFEAGQDAALTVKAGVKSDDDLYLAAGTVGASAVVKTLDADRLGGTITGGDLIVTTGGATLAANKKIVADVYYVID